MMLPSTDRIQGIPAICVILISLAFLSASVVIPPFLGVSVVNPGVKPHLFRLTGYETVEFGFAGDCGADGRRSGHGCGLHHSRGRRSDGLAAARANTPAPSDPALAPWPHSKTASLRTAGGSLHQGERRHQRS